MKQISIKKKSFGFTLVELIIVIFIMALLSTLSIANFHNGQRQRAVAIAADTVSNALLNAQNFTLAGKKTNNANASCRAVAAYYVNFFTASPTTFSLYALNNCLTNDTIETYTLPANTRIKTNGLKLGGSTAQTQLGVIFVPPFATLKALFDSPGPPYNTFSTAQIIVESNDGSVSRTVIVDGLSGRIGQ